MLVFGFCLVLLISTSEAVCPTSASGAWAEWSMWSGNCTTCTGACNQARLRLCIPNPILAGCVVEGLSCGGDPIETLACTGNAGCATTTEAPETTTTPPSCGEWAEWSCTCCGGCSTKRCTRACQATNNPGCTQTSCVGSALKADTETCTSPSVSCKMPLPVCCEGQQAYANVQKQQKWCKVGAK